MTRVTEFLPIITTILAGIFAFEVYQHYKTMRTKYLLWWTIGILNFGLGNLSEIFNIIWGWSPVNFKFWYITGALLGGFTLAQGTVYLLLPNKFGDRAAVLWSIFLAVAIVCVIMAPTALPEDFSGRLSGELFAWEWVRYFSPFLNMYAFIFSFGGAVYAANQYFLRINKEAKFIGCIYISFGALVPSIGGIYAKIGYMDVLFITGLIGLSFMYRGYRIIKKDAVE